MKNRLEKIRESLGISQSELSRRSGVSQAYISRLEKGSERPPGVDIAAALATALGVHTEQVFPRLPRGASESRQEFFARTYPELSKSLDPVDALRFSIGLACMTDDMFQSLCSWNKPMKWTEVTKIVFAFLKSIGRQAKLDELMED
jgi:transcriptional regulator with XRE-family HTH domain